MADPVESSLTSGLTTLGARAAGVKTDTDAASMLPGEKPDAILIVSPNDTQRQVLEAAFKTDVAVLCEKPLCTTQDDARWAAERAARRQALFWTAMEYRFMPPMAELVRQVTSGGSGPCGCRPSASTASRSCGR